MDRMSEHGTKKLSRREVMRGSALAAGVATIAPIGATQAPGSIADRFAHSNHVGVEINGVEHQFELESRVTLLDLLRSGCNSQELRRAAIAVNVARVRCYWTGDGSMHACCLRRP
jgi:hypothetical protein